MYRVKQCIVYIKIRARVKTRIHRPFNYVNMDFNVSMSMNMYACICYMHVYIELVDTSIL